MYINVFYRPIVYEITFVITYFDAITTYSPVCKMSSAARKFCAGTLYSSLEGNLFLTSLHHA